jgi:periplasmic protein TonB
MTLTGPIPRSFGLVMLATVALAGASAQAQFAAVPQPQKVAALQPSDAPTAKAYRIDAARHIYGAYPAHILKGKVPPLVYAILVTETEIDARGKVLKVRVLRQPAAAREVTPWVVSMIHRASPLPPPARIGRVKFVEVWLVDKSGQFQVHSLTEGQL